MKKLTQVFMLVTSFGFAMSAHASLITETWEATVTNSQSNSFYSIGDTVSWDATYDDASTEAHIYNDGPDGIARTADDTLSSTLSPSGEVPFIADAVFDFDDIFVNLVGASTEANVFTENMSIRYYFFSNQGSQYLADSEKFYMLYGQGIFRNSNYFISENIIESYILFNNASIIETKPAVPEPTTVALLGLSLVGLVGLGLLRKIKVKEKTDENIKKKSA